MGAVKQVNLREQAAMKLASVFLNRKAENANDQTPLRVGTTPQKEG